MSTKPPTRVRQVVPTALSEAGLIAMAIDVGYDPEKGIETSKNRASADGGDQKYSINDRKSSVAASIIAADLLDERYATTQRGLKSRHAQMIALGGTIGTGY